MIDKSEVREKVKTLIADSDLIGLTNWIFILRAELAVKDKALGLACKEKEKECPHTSNECTYSKNSLCVESIGSTCWRDHFIAKAREGDER